MKTGATSLSAFKGVDIPNYDVITNCMHCGLCLPTCPTYALTGLEKSSPRGRIRLIKAVADGELPISDSFVQEMNFCLDCQACETACPAGVKYGSLVEAARTQIYRDKHESLLSRLAKKSLLEWTFFRQNRLKLLARLLRIYDRTGLKWFLEKTRILRTFAPKLHAVQPLSPTISSVFSSEVLPELLKPEGPPRYRVGFLTGCIMDVAFADVNLETVKLLLHHDCEVVVPREQACCGSLQAHNGAMDAAREMAKRNMLLFDRDDLDYIVLNSAGCGAFMKEYAHLFAGDQDWGQRAERISSRVLDLTEFLVQSGYRPRASGSAFEGKRIAYHDACHLAHTQKITQQPRQLIRMVPGIQFVEIPESMWCCGSAGIYNIVHYEDSMKLLGRKIENIAQVAPDVIVTGNPGCVLQIQHGLRQRGMNIELLHTATFLWKACEQ